MRSIDRVVKDYRWIPSVFGTLDAYKRQIESSFDVRLVVRHDEANSADHIVIEGEETEALQNASSSLGYLLSLAEKGEEITDQTVDYAIRMVREGNTEELADIGSDCLLLTNRGKPIKPKTVGQTKYIKAIQRNTIVFGVGPAGTGKTYLAVAMAVKALKTHEVSRLILTRPAVEAGERLGFLPGDLQSKIDPYLRPLYDALYEMLGNETTQKFIEKMTIEIAPLAYMRGRTLDDSFIILDEAQNTTPEQMKMFLTRLGNGSKAIITGDLTQRDLPKGQKSGLVEAIGILRGIDDISIQELSDKDVVRHRLVQKIILAYDSYEKRSARGARYKPKGERKLPKSGREDKE